MKSNIIFGIGGFLIGLVAGAAGSYFMLKKKVDDLEEKFEDLEEYYETSSRYRRTEHEEKEVNPVKNDETENGRDKGPLSSEERASIKEKLNKNWEETNNYASMYKLREPELGEGGEPDDDEEDPLYNISDDEKQDYVEGMEATEEHAANRNRKPKIISEASIGEYPAYFSNETFFFYPENGVLVDDQNNEITDPETYLGDSLTKYGFDMNDEQRIFVVNYRLDTIFDVQKMKGTFYYNG